MPPRRRARPMVRIAQALADQQPDGRLTLKIGTVSAVDAGAGTDGGDVVTVTIGADDVAAPHLDSYASPAVDDEVWVLISNGSPAILGRFVGLPNF